MKNKLLKIALLLFSFGVVSATGTYLYVFHKPHRNINKEKPAFTMDARTLYEDFSVDEDASYEKYGDQVIMVGGEVMGISLSERGASLTLVDDLEGVNCSFDSAEVAQSQKIFEEINVGDELYLKGKCDGFDLIMGVVLTRCVLVDKDKFEM